MGSVWWQLQRFAGPFSRDMSPQGHPGEWKENHVVSSETRVALIPPLAESAQGKQTTSWESQSRTEKIKLCV